MHWVAIYITTLIIICIYVAFPVTTLLYKDDSWVHRHFDEILSVTLLSAVVVLGITEIF